MIGSPLTATAAFAIGPVVITWPVATTWGIVAGLGVFSVIAGRSLTMRPGKVQAVLELLVNALNGEISANIPGDPNRFLPLIGTLMLFILTANWSSLIPGVEPPTAHLETDAALAFIVFVASIAAGIRAQGFGGWLRSFTRPSWIMTPLNLIEQITRTFSLMVRLFGNVLSGVFIIGVVLSLAGLLVPIPLIALDLLTGAVQAYIFGMLALVFTASAMEGHDPPQKETK